jgi:coenzyme F420 biosynthesis associated uncharacterized protein
MGQVIDWSLATRLAGFLAGDAGHRPRPSLPALARESEQVVRAYTGLAPDRPLPEAELLDRSAWIEANLRSMRPLMEPLSARTGQGAGPLAPALRGAAGVLLAAEIGVLMGYVSRRVLGQYELVLLDAQAPARLLFVGPNLDEAAREMAVDEDDLLRWVALHEVTHALQFAGVPWLREHLGHLLRSLIASLEVGLDPSRLLRLPSAEDLRGLVRAVSSGDLLKFVAGPEQLALLERMQSTMAVLEGHAEHVMDAVGAHVLPELPRLRAAMTRRRASQSPASRVLARVLGLEMKMRQYESGKRFCDGVVELGGPAALERVWASPEALPTPEELSDPASWIRRTDVPSVTKSGA